MVDLRLPTLASHALTIEEYDVAIALIEKHLDDLKTQRELLAKEQDDASLEALYPPEITAEQAHEFFGRSAEWVRLRGLAGDIRITKPGQKGGHGGSRPTLYDTQSVREEASRVKGQGSRTDLQRRKNKPL